jgi:cytochrome c peroxidase
VPGDNRLTPGKIELGRRLFFDPVLSLHRTVSCSSCHDPEHGYSIPDRFAKGDDGQLGHRHPPTLVNVAYNTFQFWDGRVGTLGGYDSLEKQALEPIRDPREMNLDPEIAARRLDEIPEYRQAFQAAFGARPTADLIARAIASFERTLVFADAPEDRFLKGEGAALSESAARGRKLFFWKATCSACHQGPNFTDNNFHPSVASSNDEQPDVGRFAVTSQEAERGMFKTPTLRNVADRAPYMHDGSVPTLEQVVAAYNRGGFDSHYWTPEKREQIAALLAGSEGAEFRRNASPQLRAGFPLSLSEEEQRDLVTYLREALTGRQLPPSAVAH